MDAIMQALASGFSRPGPVRSSKMPFTDATCFSAWLGKTPNKHVNMIDVFTKAMRMADPQVRRHQRVEQPIVERIME
jgi:hypothetical protein